MLGFSCRVAGGKLAGSLIPVLVASEGGELCWGTGRFGLQASETDKQTLRYGQERRNFRRRISEPSK